MERYSLRSFTIGRGCHFDVPVRTAGGKGKLLIGSGNGFGVREAQRFGDGSIFLQPRRHESVIQIGDRTWINNNTTLIANERITIGNNCRIGEQVMLYDCDFHELNPATRDRSPGKTSPIIIGDNVWLGSRVMVLKGVTIGKNSVVGAMSLVTASIPPNSVAVGNPARVIRTLSNFLAPN